MTKYYLKMENAMKGVRESIVRRLNNQDGFGMIEWILLVVIIAGVTLLLKPLIQATFTKIAGLWDTELVNKFNGAK